MDGAIKNVKVKKSKPGLLIAVIILFIFCIALLVASIAYQRFLNSIVEKEAASVAAVAKTAKKVDIATALRVSTAKQVSKQERIPSYSVDQLYKMDLRKPSGVTAAELKLVTSAGLVGLEDAFVSAEKKYGVNCIFLMSIASLESAKGTMMFRPNNMFGYGRSGFSSKAEGINVVASGLSSRYLKPGGGLYGGSPTLGGVNKRYAGNPQWYAKVGSYMKQYYSVISQRRSAALAKIN